MKVFVSKCTAFYGGGMILVAANSNREALQVAHDNSDREYLFEFYDFDTGETTLKVDENYLSPFEEVEGVIYKGDYPKILLESIYYE